MTEKGDGFPPAPSDGGGFLARACAGLGPPAEAIDVGAGGASAASAEAFALARVIGRVEADGSGGGGGGALDEPLNARAEEEGMMVRGHRLGDLPIVIFRKTRCGENSDRMTAKRPDFAAAMKILAR